MLFVLHSITKREREKNMSKLKLKNNNLDDLEKYFLDLNYSNIVVDIIRSAFYKVNFFEIDLILKKIEELFYKEGAELNELLNIVQNDDLADDESIKRLDQNFSDFITYENEFYKNIEVFKKHLLEISIVVQDDQKDF